jgi:V-type H+-transporting ATPase subunit D
VAYIISELDELEREEFYRLKKIQDKKKISRAKADAAKAILKEQGRLLELQEEEEERNMLDQKDEDILF